MTEIAPPRTSRSARLRWMVPAAAGAAVAIGFLTPPLFASASTELPEMTAEELLAQAIDAEPVPLSGTVVYTARLGLPELPIAEIGGADPLALLSGSSTLRVWSDGAERSRVALLGTASEYSVVTDGPEVWTYSSSDDEAVHYTLSPEGLALGKEKGEHASAAVGADLPTPAEAAAQALERAEDDAVVTVADPVTVAGRSAYQLVVTPTSDETLVAKVVIAVDGETSLPLRVQTWSTQDGAAPSLEVGFTDIDFAAPDDAVFAFTPPSGSSVREVEIDLPDAASIPDHGDPAGAPSELPDGVSLHGSGWATIVELSDVDVAALIAPTDAENGVAHGLSFGSDSAQELIEEFVPSDGSGGPPSFDLDGAALYEQLTTEVPEGRLLSSTLLSVLVTDDGRVLAGAVPAEALRALV